MWLNNSDCIEEVNFVQNNLNNGNSNISLEEQNIKIEEIRNRWEMLKWKDLVQAEIISYFIKNPNENISDFIQFSENNKIEENKLQEIVFMEWKYENEIFDWNFWDDNLWLKITFKEYTKELVIDRETNTKWMLFIWKDWFKLNKYDFDDVSKFKSKFDSYYAYRKEWKTYVKIIKKNIFWIKDFFSEDNKKEIMESFVGWEPTYEELKEVFTFKS